MLHWDLHPIAQGVQAISAAAQRDSHQASRYAPTRSLSVWDAEERAWLAKRSTNGPSLIASGTEGLTLNDGGMP